MESQCILFYTILWSHNEVVKKQSFTLCDFFLQDFFKEGRMQTTVEMKC